LIRDYWEKQLKKNPAAILRRVGVGAWDFFQAEGLTPDSAPLAFQRPTGFTADTSNGFKPRTVPPCYLAGFQPNHWHYQKRAERTSL
jgi:hypothetical protein